MGSEMDLPAGWTEITADRHREFKATWRTFDGRELNIEVGSRDPSDDVCTAAIIEAVSRLVAEGGKVIA